jgi:hypothetical protein
MNPAAFPSPGVVVPDPYVESGARHKGAYEGMSLRDYFAAHAPEVPDDFAWSNGETDLIQRMIRWRYYYADAMLESRQS